MLIHKRPVNRHRRPLKQPRGASEKKRRRRGARLIGSRARALGKFPGSKMPRGVSRQPGSLDGAARREHLIRNWQTRREGKGEVVLSSLRAVCVVHKDPVSLILLRAFADVFPFSPPNRPSPEYPPSVPPDCPAPTLSLSLSAPPLSPPYAPPESCNGATTRSRSRTRARNDPRVHHAPFATDRRLRRCLWAAQGRDRETRCCQATILYAISRFPAEARDLPLLYSRGNVRAHYYCRNCESISYISPFLSFYFIFLLFYEIRYALPRPTLENVRAEKKYCCS